MIDQFNGDNAFLSNFYKWPVRYKGILYSSSEHAYMSEKNNDPEWKLKCSDPLVTSAAIKRLSRTVQLIPNWDNLRVGIMEQVLRAKFSHPFLRDRLLGTGNEELIEGNHWGDTFWGVCNGKGENHLGKLLMKIRTELKQQRS